MMRKFILTIVISVMSAFGMPGQHQLQGAVT